MKPESLKYGGDPTLESSCIRYTKSLVGNRFLIDDVGLVPETRERISSFVTKSAEPLRILNVTSLTTDLDTIIFSEFVSDPGVTQREVLVVFPGGGALEVKQRTKILEMSRTSADRLGYSFATVPAERVLVPSDYTASLEPRAYVGQILPRFQLLPQYKYIVVVDDVISSGATMKKLRTENGVRFPRAQWIAVTWILVKPQNERLSGITGFEKTFAAVMVQRPNGSRPNINSISTLAENEERATAYAQMHITESDQEKFLATLLDLKTD